MRDLIHKITQFFSGEDFGENGEDARLKLTPAELRKIAYLMTENARLKTKTESLINDFRDYQKEWLTNHDDIEFDTPDEDLILAFLDDTADCYISEHIS